jgi:hypothetical protein
MKRKSIFISQFGRIKVQGQVKGSSVWPLVMATHHCGVRVCKRAHIARGEVKGRVRDPSQVSPSKSTLHLLEDFPLGPTSPRFHRMCHL